MARRLAAVVLLGLALFEFGRHAGGSDAPETYTVVPGDSLRRVAGRVGVTVSALRKANGLKDDMLHPGQVLVLPHDAAAPGEVAGAARRPVRPSAGATAARPAARRKPAPKRCLEGPTDVEGDGGMAASAGLDPSRIRAAVTPWLDDVATCASPPAPVGTAWFEMTVGCDGVVDSVRIDDGAGWSPPVLECIADTLGVVPFPAHALPDGDTFLQPIGFGG